MYYILNKWEDVIGNRDKAETDLVLEQLYSSRWRWTINKYVISGVHEGLEEHYTLERKIVKSTSFYAFTTEAEFSGWNGQLRLQQLH